MVKASNKKVLRKKVKVIKDVKVVKDVKVEKNVKVGGGKVEKNTNILLTPITNVTDTNILFRSREENMPNTSKSESASISKKDTPISSLNAKNDVSKEHDTKTVIEHKDASVTPHTIIADAQFSKFSSDEALKKLFKQEKERTKKISPKQRFFLKNVLRHAGYENVDSQKLKDMILYVNALIIILLSITVIFYGSFNDVLFKAFLFLLILWVLALPVLLFITWILIYVYLDFKRYRRRVELEEVWPDYLQLVVANINAGMLIDVALWSAVKPKYKVLAKEIEEVAKQTVTGVDISIALKEFSEKYDSPMLTRTISLLVEGMGSGGKIATLLNKIALDIQDTAIMKKEMSASVMTYAIFITFATIAAAPFLFGLATQLLIVMQNIIGSVSQTSSSSSSSMLKFSTDTIKVSDFKIFAYLMLSITSFMSACIIGTIRKGSIKAGLRFIPIFIIVTITVYYVASILLAKLMSTFI